MSVSFDDRVAIVTGAHLAEVSARAGESGPETCSAQTRNELARAMAAAR